MESDNKIAMVEVTAKFKVQYSAMDNLLGLFCMYAGRGTREDCKPATFKYIGAVNYCAMFFDMVSASGIFSGEGCKNIIIGDQDMSEKIDRLQYSDMCGRLYMTLSDGMGRIDYIDDGNEGSINMLEVAHSAIEESMDGNEAPAYGTLMSEYEYAASPAAVVHVLNEVLATDSGAHLVVVSAEDSEDGSYVLTVKALDDKGVNFVNSLSRDINNDSLGRRSEVL